MSATASSPADSAHAAVPAEGAPTKKGRFSRRTMLMASGGTGALFTVLALWWLLGGPSASTIHQQVTAAVAAAESGDFKTAREQATALHDRKRSSPQSPGGVLYALGLADYFEALDPETEEPQLLFSSAVPYLRDAVDHDLKLEENPLWLLALARSLYEIGHLSDARDILEHLITLHSERQKDAVLLLTDLYLTPGIREPALLDHVLKENDALLAQPTLSPEDRALLLASRAKIFLGLNQPTRAEDLCIQLGELPVDPHNHAYLWAETDLALKQPTRALERLTKLLADEELPQNMQSRVRYLLTQAILAETAQKELSIDQRLANAQRAKTTLQEILTDFPKSHEALPARLLTADLERAAGGTERAIEAYGLALREAAVVDPFYNPWLSAKDFHDRIKATWESWHNTGEYQESMILAAAAPPVIPLREAREWAAKSAEAWAEKIEREVTSLPTQMRLARMDEYRTRWQISGKAWVAVAEAAPKDNRYPSILWSSVDHLVKAHDYKLALEQVDRFIATEPRELYGAALLRRAQILLNLDRLDETEELLTDMQKRFPTDPAIFRAQIDLGIAQMEKDDLAGAEHSWRRVLTSESLSPASMEWRDALFHLSILLVEQGILARHEAVRPPEKKTASAPGKAAAPPLERERQLDEAKRIQREASSRLTEYLARYQEGTHVPQVRYELARSQREQARLLEISLETTQTEAIRRKIDQQTQVLLEQSLENLRVLREDLLRDKQKNQLTPLGEQLLRNTSFDYAHTLFSLKRDMDAITAYNSAAGRYPEDPQVLAAYLQMAEAYRRMGRAVEARSMLEQARVILKQKQIPDNAFDAVSTNLTRQEWENWLDRVSQLGTGN